MKRTNTCRVFGSYAIWFESFLCNFRLWVLRQLFDTHTHWWSRYQLVWHWQVAGVIRLATRQSQPLNHQLKLWQNRKSNEAPSWKDENWPPIVSGNFQDEHFKICLFLEIIWRLFMAWSWRFLKKNLNSLPKISKRPDNVLRKLKEKTAKSVPIFPPFTIGESLKSPFFGKIREKKSKIPKVSLKFPKSQRKSNISAFLQEDYLFRWSKISHEKIL